MNISDLFSLELLETMIKEKMVTRIVHHELDLTIYDYSNLCQAKNAWNEVTFKCRGLVIETSTGNIVARPFNKFFNLGQTNELSIPSEIPDYAIGYEKVDGSMLNVFNYQSSWMTSTRGSFKSDQAIKGLDMLKDYKEYVDQLNPHYNYIFEIIYPENRIVVKYDFTRLILLAVIAKDGNELDINNVNWPSKAKILNTNISPEKANLLDIENEEGYVFRWMDCNGQVQRCKVKFEKYLLLHKAKCFTSNVSIWEVFYDEEKLSKLLELIPDEYYATIMNEVNKLNAEMTRINQISYQKAIEFKGQERRSVFEKVSTDEQLRAYTSFIMKRLDDPNKNIDFMIIKHLKPQNTIFLLNQI
jgi:RNA ligase